MTTDDTPRFTPGPWRASRCWPKRIYGGDNRLVAEPTLRNKGDWNENTRRCAANAALIAAAPEMYALLEELATCGAIPNGAYVERINNLLAKCRGEEEG